MQQEANPHNIIVIKDINNVRLNRRDHPSVCKRSKEVSSPFVKIKTPTKILDSIETQVKTLDDN
jgi:hypothetical protein